MGDSDHKELLNFLHLPKTHSCTRSPVQGAAGPSSLLADCRYSPGDRVVSDPPVEQQLPHPRICNLETTDPTGINGLHKK